MLWGTPNTSGSTCAEGDGSSVQQQEQDEGSSQPGGSSAAKSTAAAAAAMMFPLVVALAYLDAIAKTWLAIGEKLHDSIYGNSASSSTSRTAAWSTTAGTSATVKAKRSTQTSGTRQQQRHGCHLRYRRQQQPNRLEFSLGDFLRSKIHDPFGTHRTCCATDTNASPSPQDDGQDTDTSSDEASTTRTSHHDAGHQTARYSTDRRKNSAAAGVGGTGTPWPLRFRRGGRRPKGLPVSTRPRATDKTLVLDLDETLIHARKQLPSAGERFDFMVVLPPKSMASSTLGVHIGGLCCSPSCSSYGTGSSSASGRNSTGRAHNNSRGKHTNISQYCDVGATNRDGSKSRIAGGESGTRGGRGGSIAAAGSRVGMQWQWGSGERRIYVRRRPHLKKFLEAVSAQFEIVIFTAARAEFAQAVLDEIDPRREMVDHMLSRDSCTRLMLSRKKRAAVVKDLGIIGRPLSKVIMVENSLDAIRYHLENGVHIASFYGDRDDTELLSTLASLKDLSRADDVRDGIIRLYVETQARKEGQSVLSDSQCAPIC